MLIRKVESFMRNHDMPATKFGRLAARDPRFVLDLRMGRTPRPSTEARIRRWMAEYETQIPAPASNPAHSRAVFETKELSYAL